MQQQDRTGQSNNNGEYCQHGQVAPSEAGADLFEKCRRFVQQPRVLREADRRLAESLFAELSPADNAGPWIEADRRRILQFSTNNYLGLATHPEVCAQAARVVDQVGIGAPMGSRLLTGTTAAHVELEAQVAAFKRCEAALTFPSGALAMMGVLGCLAGPDDVLVLDELAHATLVCGARIATCQVVNFRHNDVDHLESVLERLDRAQAAAIVVDGVYSMDGDIAPLAEMVELKHRFGARLIVDDAHGTGVFGPNGRGVAAELGVEDQVDLHLGTFSKAVGTIGGFVAGPQAVIDFLRFHAPTFVFTKSTPLAVVAATKASLKLLQEAEALRKRLWENTQRLQQGLRDRGFDIGRTQSPITPIVFQGSAALYMAHALRTAYNIWVSPVMYPAVRLGRSLLRVIPTAVHTSEDIDYLIEALCEARAALTLGTMPVS